MLAWSHIAGGSHHSLIVTDGGDVYSMGSGSDGQLGNGSYERLLALSRTLPSTSRLTSDIPVPSFVPFHVRDLGTRVVHVSAGDRFSACIDSGGSVYTWGFEGTLDHDLSGSHHVSRLGTGPPSSLVASDVAQLRFSEMDWLRVANSRPRIVRLSADKPMIKNLSCGADHVVCVSVDGDTYSCKKF
jgi:alpha-tubulin suppressor-like RCC1 family protein